MTQPIGLDWRRILTAGIGLGAIWAIGMTFITVVGKEPGVACVSPLAWLLGLVAGLRIGAQSSSASNRRGIEGAIAGAICGALVGASSLAVLTAMSPEVERAQVLPLGAGLLAAGVLVSAGLGFVGARVAARRG